MSEEKTVYRKIKDSKIFPVVFIIVLLLIPMFVSTYIRIQPYNIPVTDSWAAQTVNNFYRSNFVNQVNTNYPHLSESQKNIMIDKMYSDFLKENKDRINGEIAQVSSSFKEQLRDENNKPYLSDIDTYLWYGMAKNYDKFGGPGIEKIEGTNEWLNLRNNKEGKELYNIFSFPYYEYKIYKLVQLFNSDIELIDIAFFMSVIIITLSVIPAFFIGRMIAGNISGIIAGLIVAVHPALMARTTGGVADSDPLHTFYPLFIVWLIMLAYHEKENIKLIIYSALAGILLATYPFAWSGWFYSLNLIIYSIGFAILLKLGYNYYQKKKDYSFLKKDGLIAGSFILFTILFMVINYGIVNNNPTQGITEFVNGFIGPINFLNYKAVGVTTIWPNVLTTVAELNLPSFDQVLGQMNKLLLLLAFIGSAFALYFMKDEKGNHEPFYASFILVGLLSTLLASTKGIRFVAIAIPFIAIGVGYVFGIITKWVAEYLEKTEKISKYWASIAIFFVIALPLLTITAIVPSWSISTNSFTMYNDGWENSLNQIKEHSNDSLITSWWDFGHWFVSEGERRVTFDGGDQGNRIHWVGKSLITKSEEESIAILRMLNCGGEHGYNTVLKYLNVDSNDSNYKTLVAKKLTDKIILESKEDAKQILSENKFNDEQVKEILGFTHCDNLIPHFMIASGDMVGKSGVWGHFGSWDFDRAYIWNVLNRQEYKYNLDKSIEFLKTEYNYSDIDARRLYSEATITEGDQWITGWPAYIGGASGTCQLDGQLLKCTNGVVVDFNNIQNTSFISRDGTIPKPQSVVYPTKDGIVEIKIKNANQPFSVALNYNQNSGYTADIMSSEHAGSMFNIMFYYNGHGLKNYKLFSTERQITGEMIYVYLVDYENESKTIVDNYNIEEVKAAHILIRTPENATEEELNNTLKNITEIRKRAVNGEDFRELAIKYSEDPSKVSNGGDLGYFTKGMMVPEFEQAAFSTEIGEVSDIIKTQFGYHILKVSDKRTKDVFNIKNEIVKLTENNITIKDE